MPWKKWRVSKSDAQRVKELVEEQKDTGNALLLNRMERNLAEYRPCVDRGTIWFKMVCALLTTQQKSGPGTPIHKFIHERPFPLAYRTVRAKSLPEKFMAGTLDVAEGIRRHNRIARELGYNLDKLRNGEWENALREINRLSGSKPTTKNLERAVASYIRITFKGFGPKQSRNLLQMLGLTRYEIPIDSRMIKWLAEFGYPRPLSSKLLSDRKYYELVLDDIQVLCRKAGVEPCILDAAVFKVQGGR